MSCDDPACGREEASSSWRAPDQEVRPHAGRHLTKFVVRPLQPVRCPNLPLNASLSAVKRLDRDVQPSQTSAKSPRALLLKGGSSCAP